MITPEDIQRSGAINIPDLLRMVPGVYAAQINANAWVICIRGFNDRLSNELLVLVDGQSVYTPTFGGVFWEMKPTAVQGGAQALAALEAARDLGEPFKLILNDTHMPNMDGFALIERILSNLRCPQPQL